MIRVLVVTGGIGSGKSEVCRLLKDKGLVFQYDADRRAKALYGEYPELVEAMETALHADLRDGDGRFVPALLAEIIFSDGAALKIVEELLFPVLMRDFERFLSDVPSGQTVVFESATILEKAYFDGFGDYVLLVDAPVSLRLSRACARDNASMKQIRDRMDNQTLLNEISDGAACPRADHIILNDGTLGDLEQKVNDFLNDKFILI